MSQYGDRIIKAKWKYKESVGFLTGIAFKGIDRKGFIRKISEIISDKHNINIRSLRVDTSEGQTEGIIMLYVNDLVSLNKLLEALRKVKEIISVNRVDRLDRLD
jgi:GTP pyrophosphokinase